MTGWGGPVQRERMSEVLLPASPVLSELSSSTTTAGSRLQAGSGIRMLGNA